MILLYILKSSACLTLFLLFYKLFLEKENFHVFKRFFLLTILLASFIIPLITFKKYTEVPLEILGLNGVSLDSSRGFNDVKVSAYNFSQLLMIIYCLGVLIIGVKFFKNLTHLLRKVSANPNHKSNDFTIVLLKEEIAPYSFLNYIFFTEKKYMANKIPQEVLLHEKAHVKQKHTLDIIFIEIIQIIFWFNPIFYPIKKAIKLNHEFLADNAVLKKGINIKNYQNSLLNFFMYPQEQQLASSINYSLIAKRFLIMNKKLNKKRVYLKVSIIAPLFIILLSGFSNTVIVQIPIENSIDRKESIKTDVEDNIMSSIKQNIDSEINVDIPNENLIDRNKRIETDTEVDVSVPKGFVTSLITNLADNGAIFDYNGKQISSEKAIAIAEITDFVTQRDVDSNRLIVYLSEHTPTKRQIEKWSKKY